MPAELVLRLTRQLQPLDNSRLHHIHRPCRPQPYNHPSTHKDCVWYSLVFLSCMLGHSSSFHGNCVAHVLCGRVCCVVRIATAQLPAEFKKSKMTLYLARGANGSDEPEPYLQEWKKLSDFGISPGAPPQSPEKKAHSAALTDAWRWDVCMTLCA